MIYVLCFYVSHVRFEKFSLDSKFHMFHLNNWLLIATWAKLLISRFTFMFFTYQQFFLWKINLSLCSTFGNFNCNEYSMLNRTHSSQSSNSQPLIFLLHFFLFDLVEQCCSTFCLDSPRMFENFPKLQSNFKFFHEKVNVFYIFEM